MLAPLINHIEATKRGQIVLDYEGLFSDDITEQSIDELEDKLSPLLSNSNILKKRVIYLFVELFQNVIRHGYISEGEVKPFGKVTINIKDTKCFISSYNFCEPNKIDSLIEHIEELNHLTIEQIRDQFRLRLEQNAFSDKGGAGLGLIDMRRRTKNKIMVNLLHQPNNLSVFCMMLQVDLK